MFHSFIGLESFGEKWNETKRNEIDIDDERWWCNSQAGDVARKVSKYYLAKRMIGSVMICVECDRSKFIGIVQLEFNYIKLITIVGLYHILGVLIELKDEMDDIIRNEDSSNAFKVQKCGQKILGKE